MKKLLYTIVIVIFLYAEIVNPAHAVDVTSKPIDSMPTAPTTIEGNSSAHLLADKQPDTDERVTKLKVYLKSKNSPLVDESVHFIKQADAQDLDWKLVAAISGVESTFGKHIPPGSYNGWGWGIPTGAESGIMFKNWNEGIRQISQGLRKNYVNRGATTIEQIGRIYAASPSWSWKVRFFMDQIENFSPNSPQLLSVSL